MKQIHKVGKYLLKTIFCVFANHRLSSVILHMKTDMIFSVYINKMENGALSILEIDFTFSRLLDKKNVYILSCNAKF